MDLKQLLADLAKCDEQLDALTSKRELSTEEEQKGESLLAEREKIKAAIGRQKDKAARDEERAALEAEAAKAARTVQPGANRITRPVTGSTPDEQGRGSQVLGTTLEETAESIDIRLTDDPTAQKRLAYAALRKQNLRLLKSANYGPWNEFKSAGDFLAAVRDAEVKRSDGKLMDRLHKHYGAVVGMSEGIGQDGGYMVMPEYAMGIIDRIYANSLWAQTDSYNVSGNSMVFFANAETSRATGSRHGGLRSYYMAEGAATTASKPTLREVTLKLIKAGVLVYMTEELLSDGGGALQQYTANKVGQEFNFVQGDSLINGTGAGQPLGILNAPSLVSVAKESGQGAATLLTENVLKMYARFYAPGLPRMQWLINQDTQPQLDQLQLAVGTGGVPLFVGPNGLAGAPYGTLRARPITPTEFNATLGTQGDIISADLSQIISINKGGVAQAVSMHVQFLTQQMAFLFTLRFNARPWESAPITPYKGSSNTQSNFVTLDTRS